MKLGDKILKLRKQKGLSQEQLGEQINVTRQTISNWELESTAPNPEQLKLLSKVLDVSIDELLDNDRKEDLISKVSNTEKLAGIIIKILKFFGIAFIVFLIIDIIALIVFSVFSTNGEITTSATSVSLSCKINDNFYDIEFDTNKNFSCKNCSNVIKNDLIQLIDFKEPQNSIENIEKYFITQNGRCE